MIVDRYFYHQLPDFGKEIYKTVYKGLMNHDDLIELQGDQGEIMGIMPEIQQSIMDDNPLIYYVNQTVFEMMQDADGSLAFKPQYFFTKEKVAEYNAKIQDVANKLIQRLDLTVGSDYEKVKKVHDYFCSEIDYDYGGSDVKDPVEMIRAHTILGVFSHKKAQCEGVAKAVKVLLNGVDVKCIYASGKAQDNNGNRVDHGWNIVNIDGKPYNLDVTFDMGSTKDGIICCDYFNLTDKEIKKDHFPMGDLPKCIANDDNYFEKTGASFSAKGKLKDYISSEVKSGRRKLHFRVTGRLKAASIVDEMAEFAISEIGDAKLTKYSSVTNNVVNTCSVWIEG